MIMIPIAKTEIAAVGCTITGGIAEMMRMVWPTRATAMDS